MQHETEYVPDRIAKIRLNDLWVVTEKQWDELVETELASWRQLQGSCSFKDKIIDYYFYGERSAKRILFEKWKSKSTVGDFLLEMNKINNQNARNKILTWIVEASSNSEGPWSRVKLFVVGDGEVGKTSLINYLRGLEFQPTERTDGIDIHTLEIKNWSDVELNVWEHVAEVLQPKPEPDKPLFRMAILSQNLGRLCINLVHDIGSLFFCALVVVVGIVFSSNANHKDMGFFETLIFGLIGRYLGNKLLWMVQDYIPANTKKVFSLLMFLFAFLFLDLLDILTIHMSVIAVVCLYGLKRAAEWHVQHHPVDIPTSADKIRFSRHSPVAFHVWDFAGQEDYYSTHHFFLSPAAIYLLVINLATPLDEDRVSFWLESKRCYAPNAPIIIAGTHADMVQNEVPQSTLDRVKQIAAVKNMDKTVFCDPSLIVDCTNQIAGRLETVRSYIEGVGTKNLSKRNCKIRWMVYFDKLTKAKQDPLLTCLNLGEAEDIAVQCKMNRDETVQALNFFHEMGFIFYDSSDTAVSHAVFTNPTQLINALRCLVSPMQYETKVTKYYEDMRNQGKLELDHLKLLWNQFAEHFTKLEHLIKRFELAIKHPQYSYLLVPCIAKKAPELSQFERAPKIRLTVAKVPPLGFASRLVYAMVVYNKEEPRLFRGGCMFSRDQSLVCVEIKSVEVTIQVLSNVNTSIVLEELIRQVEAVVNDLGGKVTTKYFVCQHQNTAFNVSLNQASCDQCKFGKHRRYYADM